MVGISPTFHLGESLRPTSEAGPGRRDRSSAELRIAVQRLASLMAPLCGAEAERLAAELIGAFGSLPALVRSNPRALRSRLPGRSDLAELLLAVGPLIDETLRAEALDAPVLPDNRAAVRYLHAVMAHELAEQMRILYLDAKNRILRDEVAAHGSVTRTDIFPREIVRRALDLGATGFIMAHNHPSGDPEPSPHDLTATRAVADAARLFDLVLHDHIVLGRSGYRSLREEGYL